MIPPDEIIPSRRNELTRFAGGTPIITGMANDLLALARKSGEQTPATLGPTVRSPWTVPDLSLDMLWCGPGSFQMGSPEDEKGREDDETLHEVTLTSGYWLGKHSVTQADWGYWLGKHPVTQAQWQKVMGDNPSFFKGASRPVAYVTWTDVTSFCEKLTEQESEAGRLPAGMAYQLPTEAQWEYACRGGTVAQSEYNPPGRAGTTKRFAFGDELTAEDANFDGNVGETTDVGKYPANAWGFHDMHGNVWEWTADWYKAYPTGAVRDPVGPADGSYRVLRGGSWISTASSARSANRGWLVPACCDSYLGFRLSLRPVSQ
jgi:sulfatase modifying factor 1